MRRMEVCMQRCWKTGHLSLSTVMGIRQIIILNLTDCMAGNVIRKRKMPECGVSWEARLRKKIRII